MRCKSLLVCVLLLAQTACDRKAREPSSEIVERIALPGAEPFTAEFSETLRNQIREKGPDYKPRTRHLRSDGSAKYTNRLISEPSPYLGQHAHNPVNWYSWGEEAFETAKRLDRPIFLSIGYSTCHWCHVMEEESFEDEEVARYLNENYVAIKVDREERPDIDSIYMSALLAMGQSGGWPLNMWLTPERKPFYGGTYFPPDGARLGRPGFRTVLGKLKSAFDGDRDKLLQSSQQIADSIERMTQPPAGTDAVPGESVLANAAQQYAARYDAQFGGLVADRRGSKFPSSLPVRFLLRYARRSGDAKFSDMAVFSLDRMAAGGMYDQIGGGFHRYSTDPQWLVPHFEKMLYDNALLVMSYLEAFVATGEERHARIASDILSYVAREMRSPDGAFFSATDADSVGPTGEREEGYYFTWTPQELEEALGTDKAKLVSAHWGVTKRGNFEGRSILSVQKPLAEVASAQGLEVSEAEGLLAEAREILYRARQRRPAPHTDDKVLVAWNGLMISAYARAAQVLGAGSEGSLDHLEIASRAADYILASMRDGERLLRSSQGGKSHLRAYVDDYAFLIAGLLDLYSASGQVRWLDQAIALQTQLDSHYADERGGYFMTSDDHEELLTREKPASDNAIPSGNSVAVMNLLRLHQLTGKTAYVDRADAALRAFGSVLRDNPHSLSQMLLALDYRTDAVKQIVIVGPVEGDTSAFRKIANSTWVPNRVYVETREGEELDILAAKVPLVESKVAMDGKVTAYVCEDTQCSLPTSDPDVFRNQLAQVRAYAAPVAE